LSTVESKQGGANVRIPPPLIFLVGIASGWAIDHYIQDLPMPLGRMSCLLAATVCGLMGFLLIGHALALFKQSGQEPEPWRPSPELIGKGPYRFTRNPMYVGMLLLQCAAGFALSNAWVLVLAPISLLGVHVAAVLPEERYLTHKFGAGYTDYVARTPRYLGWPR